MGPDCTLVMDGGEGGIAAPAGTGLSFGLAHCASELAFGSVRTLLSGSNPSLLSVHWH